MTKPISIYAMNKAKKKKRLTLKEGRAREENCNRKKKNQGQILTRRKKKIQCAHSSFLIPIPGYDLDKKIIHFLNKLITGKYVHGISDVVYT